MTREVAKKIAKGITDKIECNTVDIDDWAEFWGFTREEYEEFLDIAICELEQEPCEDAISRRAIIDMTGLSEWFDSSDSYNEFVIALSELPPVTPKSRTGQWIRMSDLSEQEDDRYKCSHCGNVIHHKNKMNLYTFNSWCGRCGSDNGRK